MAFRIGEAFVEVTADDNTDSAIRGIGNKLTGWAAGLGLGALIGGSINDNLDIETGRARLQNQLGLTAEDARTYGDLAGSVYRDNFGGSLDEVNGVIGQVGTAMGGLGAVSNSEIQSMTGNILTFADTFDQDATQSVASLSAAVSNGLAPSLQNATDIATRVFQQGGPKAEEFLEVINEYAPNLAQAGISMEQFGAMSVSYLDAGGFSIDQFADSIREMNIRILDGSAASSGAFDTLGLNAEDMTAKIAAGGPGAQAAMQQIIGALTSMTDPVAQQTAGAQLFGSMWEDSSGAILAGLSPVEGALGDVAGATQEMSDVAGSTRSSGIESFKRGIEGWIASLTDSDSILGQVGGAINDIAGPIASSVAPFAMIASAVTGFDVANVKATASTIANKTATVASAAATGTATAAQWLWNTAVGAGGLVADAGRWVANTVARGASAAATGAATAAQWLWNAATTGAGMVVDTARWVANVAVRGTVAAATGIATAAQWAWNIAMNANPIALIIIAITALVAGLVWFFTQTEVGRQVIEAVWSAIQTAIGATVSWITDTVVPAIGNAWQWIVDRVVWVKDMYVAIWSAIISTVADAVTGIWNFVSTIIGNVVSFLYGAWTGALNTVISVFGSIGSFIWSTISNVISTIGALPGQIIGMFANAGSWLLDAGGNIVRGIWNGISGMGSWLWNKISNFAGNIVDSALGALGIHSPSTVFRDEVGRWIPAGVAEGIEGNMGPLEDSLADMAGVRGPTISPSGTFDATGMPGIGGGRQTGIVSTTPSGTVIQINNLTLQIDGNFDFSNPVDWQRFIEAVRDGLVNLERQYS